MVWKWDILIGFLVVSLAHAESLDGIGNDRRGGWFGYSYGVNSIGLSKCANGTLAVGNHLLSVRWLGSREVAFWFGVDDSLREVGFLYGHASETYPYRLSVSAGVGYVRGTIGRKMDPVYLGLVILDEEEVKVSTVGIPFEAEAIIHLRYVGIGTKAIANFNRSRSYWGGMLGIYAGRFR